MSTTSTTTEQQQTLTYRELQTKLKSMREAGQHLNCKLNSTFDVLAAELARLTSSLPVSKTISKAAQAKAERESRVMSYRELQAALKVLKSEGKTSIKLNHKYEVLLNEYNRLTCEAA